METALIVAVLLLVGAVLWLALRSRKPEPAADQSQAMLMLQNQIGEINKTIDSKLSESTRVIQTQHGQSTKIIQDITERLTKLDETNRQVVGFADQLKNLQDILKNPKQRGVLGEYYLETVLQNVLPPKSFQMQYAFKNGEIVDAVVFVKDKIIPIDSKFSLENYQRILATNDPAEKERLEKVFKQDLKNRIDETSKYIRPAENTMDFAFMFIPSEAIYYDLLINKVGVVQISTQDLITYAFNDKHVIIVSPTSFLAYLQTVLQGLRAMQIEESAKEIRKNVEALGRHVVTYDTYLQKLGSNLGTTVNMYNSAYTEFKKIDKDVLKVTGGESSIEPLLIEKPRVE